MLSATGKNVRDWSEALALAQSSHKSSFWTFSSAVMFVKNTVAGFSLQTEHIFLALIVTYRYNYLLVYRLANGFSQGTIIFHQLFRYRTGLAVANDPAVNL